MAKSSLIFISGGVRSGKSSFAEKVAIENAQRIGGRLHYLATGKDSDSEMSARILRHRQERLSSGFHWTTWEQSKEIDQMIEKFSHRDIVLLDCLTTLLNNELFAIEDGWLEEGFRSSVRESILSGIEGIKRSAQCLIVVSNEVFYEHLGDADLIETYSMLLGELHQRIVAKADAAFLVEVGIPIRMKGSEEYEGTHDSRNRI